MTPLFLTKTEWFDRLETWETNILAAYLLAPVSKAAWKLVNQYDRIGELDDLLGVGSLAMARVLPRILAGEIDDPPAFVYRVSRRAGLRYLLRCPLTDPDLHPTTIRLPEIELISRTEETWQAILAACLDDLDREIIHRKSNGHTNAAIAKQLGVNKSTITRRLQRIRDSLRNSCNI